jgi:hypothetical protein
MIVCHGEEKVVMELRLEGEVEAEAVRVLVELSSMTRMPFASFSIQHLAEILQLVDVEEVGHIIKVQVLYLVLEGLEEELEVLQEVREEMEVRAIGQVVEAVADHF